VRAIVTGDEANAEIKRWVYTGDTDADVARHANRRRGGSGSAEAKAERAEMVRLLETYGG
jgi:hypothetical protein